MQTTCRHLLIAFSLGVGVAPAHAGHLVRGSVRDAATGEGLPAATVQITGTFQGTIANDEGEYALEVPTVPAVIRVTYIGYASLERTLADTGVTSLDFELTVSPLVLPPMVVRPEMAAEIMAEVIRRKQEWVPRVLSYRAEVYTRRAVERSDEIVMMGEVVSDVYWDHDRGRREVVKSTRHTSNMQDEGMTSALEGTVNLYDDDIEFLTHKMIGPTHPDALKHYRFEILGRRAVDESIVYDIGVEPRSRLSSAFVGQVSVLDDEFGLLEADLVPSRAALATVVPVPLIEGLETRLRQQFRQFEGGVWLPVDLRMSVAVEIGMVGLQFPLIGMEQTTRIASYEVNVQLPDSLYAEQRIDPWAGRYIEGVRMDTAAVAADTAFSSFPDPVPMSQREAAAFDTITPQLTPNRAFRPTGFLTRFIDLDEEEVPEREPETEAQPTSEPAAEPRAAWRDELPDFAGAYRFNRVEEAQLAVKLDRPGPVGTHLRGGAGFSSGLEKLSLEGGARREWSWRPGRTSIEVDYRRGGGSHYGTDIYPVLVNTVQALLGEDDYFDYYWTDGYGVAASHVLPSNRGRVRLSWRGEDHESLESTTDFDLLGRSHVLRPNPQVDEGRMRRLELAMSVGGKREPLGVSAVRRAELTVEHSDDWMGSDFDFTRLHVGLDWHQPTFLRRRLAPNDLDVKFVAGTRRGRLPVQRFGALDVAVGPLSPYGTLRGANGHPFVGERYLGVFGEHNFRTSPFEYLGLWPLVKRGFGAAVFAAYGQTWIDADRRARLPIVPRWTKTPHKEAGAALVFYHLGRLDVTRRLDPGGWSVGISIARLSL